MKTVKEVAKTTGVSVRTLHYYDEIGLLSPSGMTPGGYRLYDDTAMARLQQILFFRELDFPLKEILNSDSFDERRALREHRKLLIMKKERLERLIRLADERLKGEKHMSFKEFDGAEIERVRREYAAEARERWGGTQAYAQSEQRTAKYGKEQWERIEREANGIYQRLAGLMKTHAPHDREAQALVWEWQEHISKYYYDCTREILAGLGEMYVADERFRRNIDAHAEGLAEFLSKAIRVYCT